jgi:hypothetical protein
MNTRLGKSFGLAFVVAVGILALMFALGTFNAQKAGADHVDNDVLSSQKAGAGVSLTIEFTPNEIITAGDDLVIELEDFQIQSPIDADAISIKGATTANAADVSVSGSKITVEIPDMDGNAGAVDDLAANKLVTIRVRSRAGVKNPTLADNTYMIKVTHGQVTLYEENPGPINATLKVAPEKGIEGEALTVSGVGFSTGTATIYLVAGDDVPAAGSADTTPDDFKSVGSATVSDGSFSTSVTVGDKFEAGANDLMARSSTGKWGAQDGFNLNGAISLPDSVTKGTDLTVKVSKWSAGPITRATINGEDMVSIDADGDIEDAFSDQTIKADKTAEFKIRVGPKALLGEQTLILYTGTGAGEESAGQTNIEVIGIALNVSPSTAVVGQEVTVTGSGFTNGGTIDTLTFGGVNVIGQIVETDRGVASGGRVVAAFRIPDNSELAGADDYSISLSDGTRTGSATVTIPERTLTVDPTEGRIGSPINLSGTGWPTGTGANLVGLYYDGDQYASAITDSSGEWSASIEVPHEVGVGSTHDVEAKATVGGASADEDNVKQKAEHSTPDAVVTLSSAKAQRGTNVTVSGENFNVFETVMIEIGDSDVTPAGTTTDGVGSFSTDVLVPGLALGNKNLKVTVKGVPVVEFLEIVSTPVVTTMTVEEAFGDLIDNGSLTTVWRYDFDTRTWTSYTTDPETSFGNDLFELDSGDILYVHVSSDQSFSHQKGETLSEGWSLITLN